MGKNLVTKEVNQPLQASVVLDMKGSGCTINNASKQDMGALEGVITRFYPYAKGKLGFKDDISVNLVSDPQNSKDPFGKTAYYDPNKMEITIFVDKRHVKDMLRSFSHELVHHAQNCRGDFEHSMNLKPGYAQKDPHMRRMEAEAYLLGNGFLVRDYEDQMKYGQLKENKQMSITKEQAMQIAEKLVEEMLPEQFAAYKSITETEEEVVEEEAKPDFPDVDGDGDKEEPISKAQKDKKEKEGDDKKDDDKEEKSDKDLSKVPPQLRKHVAKKKGNVNEEIDHRNNLLFEKLTKKWTK